MIKLYKGDCLEVMNNERKEYLFNKAYYSYLEKEEAEELINYLTKLEKENSTLKTNCNLGNENLIFYRKEYKKYKDKVEKIRKILEQEYSFTKRHDIPLMSKDEQLAGKLFDILGED